MAHSFAASSGPRSSSPWRRLARAWPRRVTYDGRGHGESGGLCTLGDAERHDVAAAVALAHDTRPTRRCRGRIDGRHRRAASRGRRSGARRCGLGEQHRPGGGFPATAAASWPPCSRRRRPAAGSSRATWACASREVLGAPEAPADPRPSHLRSHRHRPRRPTTGSSPRATRPSSTPPRTIPAASTSCRAWAMRSTHRASRSSAPRSSGRWRRARARRPLVSRPSTVRPTHSHHHARPARPGRCAPTITGLKAPANAVAGSISAVHPLEQLLRQLRCAGMQRGDVEACPGSAGLSSTRTIRSSAAWRLKAGRLGCPRRNSNSGLSPRPRPATPRDPRGPRPLA